ncbi:MAG: hypothetical protein HY913_14530 [Desulfomonile tiedjei]|nr:hypothetical protein [Desulfomonile tiedjei]
MDSSTMSAVQQVAPPVLAHQDSVIVGTAIAPFWPDKPTAAVRDSKTAPDEWREQGLFPTITWHPETT